MLPSNVLRHVIFSCPPFPSSFILTLHCLYAVIVSLDSQHMSGCSMWKTMKFLWLQSRLLTRNHNVVYRYHFCSQSTFPHKKFTKRAKNNDTLIDQVKTRFTLTIEVVLTKKYQMLHSAGNILSKIWIPSFVVCVYVIGHSPLGLWRTDRFFSYFSLMLRLWKSHHIFKWVVYDHEISIRFAFLNTYFLLETSQS